MARKRKKSPGPYLLRMELLRERIPEPDGYPYNLPAIRGLSKLAFHPKVTFLVGENGSGKSTLLEAIAVGCGMNPEGGGRNFNFSTRASHSPLGECIRLTKAPATLDDTYFLRAESFFNLATEIEQLDQHPDQQKSETAPIGNSYGRSSLHNQSHGESFFSLFENRFGGHGLYLLDEPEAALSPKRQLQFLAMLHIYLQRGSQFLIATHSPIIMAYPDARIYSLDDESGIREVAYEETDHYQVTRGFLNAPQRSLRVLMAESQSPSTSDDEEAEES
jgi:predicted ATPase